MTGEELWSQIKRIYKAEVDREANGKMSIRGAQSDKHRQEVGCMEYLRIPYYRDVIRPHITLLLDMLTDSQVQSYIDLLVQKFPGGDKLFNNSSRKALCFSLHHKHVGDRYIMMTLSRLLWCQPISVIVFLRLAELFPTADWKELLILEAYQRGKLGYNTPQSMLLDFEHDPRLSLGKINDQNLVRLLSRFRGNVDNACKKEGAEHTKISMTDALLGPMPKRLQMLVINRDHVQHFRRCSTQLQHQRELIWNRLFDSVCCNHPEDTPVLFSQRYTSVNAVNCIVGGLYKISHPTYHHFKNKFMREEERYASNYRF